MAYIVAIEGTSNSFKSTTINYLIEKLEQTDIRVIDIRHLLKAPSTVSQSISAITHPTETFLSPTQEVFLYSTLLAHKRLLINKYLADDCLIILDRYDLSIIVLGHFVRGLPYESIKNIIELATEKVYPDLTIIMDTDYQTYFHRLTGMGRRISRKEQGGEKIINAYIEGFRSEAMRLKDKAVIIETQNLTLDKIVDSALDAIIENCPEKYFKKSKVVMQTNKSTHPRLLSLEENNWPTFNSIVFDLEGTLFFSPSFGEEVHRLAKECVAEAKGLNFADADALFESTRKQLSQQNGFKVALTETMLNLGIELKFWNDWQAKVDLNQHVDIDVEIIDMFEKLNSRYTIIVVTNMTSALAERTLIHLGINSSVTELITSDKCGFSKPNPMIYKIICQKYSLNPSQVLSIGDRYNVDVEPALEYGTYGCVIKGKLDLLWLSTKL